MDGWAFVWNGTGLGESSRRRRKGMKVGEGGRERSRMENEVAEEKDLP